MKRGIITAILVILCFVLQSTVFKEIAFAGIVPNLLIVATSSLGFMRGEKTGLLTGFFCGLLMDIFFGEAIGLYAMIYMYAGYLNGKFNDIFYPEDIKLPLALILVSNLGVSLLSYLLLFMMRGRFAFLFYFRNVILPEMAYTALVTLLLYPVILWIHHLLEESEKRKV